MGQQLRQFNFSYNGSGKNAVLIAVTICLGGRASSTKRGQSLKSFIKWSSACRNIRQELEADNFRQKMLRGVK